MKIKRWSHKALITVTGIQGKHSEIACYYYCFVVVVIAIIYLFSVLAHAIPAAWLELPLICKSSSYLAFSTRFKQSSRKPSNFFPEALTHSALTWQSHLNMSTISPSRLPEGRVSIWFIFEAKCLAQNLAICREFINIPWMDEVKNCLNTHLRLLYKQLCWLYKPRKIFFSWEFLNLH